MAKTYKEMKEAWVTGHTGGSVADVNSVSLAMPVPYTTYNPYGKLLLTMYAVEYSTLVRDTATVAIVYTVHVCCLLRRFSAQLHRYVMRNHHLLVLAMDIELPLVTACSWSSRVRKTCYR
jgi:hypothetical protein